MINDILMINVQCKKWMKAKAFPSCNCLEINRSCFSFLAWLASLKMYILQEISAECTPSKSSLHTSNITSKFPHTYTPHIPNHNPPQKPNPILHRPKLLTVLTQKMKMKKMPLKTVKMTSWMSKKRRMMKRRLLIARKTVKRRQKCWQQSA